MAALEAEAALPVGLAQLALQLGCALRDDVALLAAEVTLPLGLLRRPRLFRGELRAFRFDMAILLAVVASPGRLGRGG
jgi:hypothetical protein